ncbi:MAG TPA: ectoine/hydroxyectoine ABC transporter substrate-binding protein EhuB [Burkholderiales bacterium]
MRPERRAAAWLVLAAGLAAAAAGCGGEPPGGTLEKARREGRLRVGFANEPPFAYQESATGRLTGEAPEIARVVLKQLGVGEIEGVLTEFGSLIPGLQARRFDMIAAGMYILPERCAQIAFSDPTYSVAPAFVVAKGNPLDLHGYRDVAKHASARLGVVAGAVERSYARKSGIPDERVVVFPDAASALEGVAAGRVDAFAATSLTVNSLLARAGSDALERAAPFEELVIDGKPVRGYGAFGFRKDDRKLLEAFNAALARYVGTPGHLATVKPFGFTEAELPKGASAASLCKAS